MLKKKWSVFIKTWSKWNPPKNTRPSRATTTIVQHPNQPLDNFSGKHLGYLFPVQILGCSSYIFQLTHWQGQRSQVIVVLVGIHLNIYFCPPLFLLPIILYLLFLLPLHLPLLLVLLLTHPTPSCLATPGILPTRLNPSSFHSRSLTWSLSEYYSLKESLDEKTRLILESSIL